VIQRALAALEFRLRHASPGKPKDPFSLALDTLRARLGDGRLILGEPLTITDLAQELGLSATPVREALSRLAGEGLIEDRRGRGYFAKRLDFADLVELYGLRRLYLVEAAAEASRDDLGAILREIGAGQPALATVLQAYDRLVAGAGNRVLMESYRIAFERLVGATRAEAALFDAASEWAELTAAMAHGAAVLVDVITRHHRDRQSRSGEIVRAMRAYSNISSL
jgi:DNA-binding GntR family transcriptional regulator